MRDGRRIKSSLENDVPIVVSGLSTSSSSSAFPTSPTSVLQEAEVPTLHPRQQEVRVRVTQYEPSETKNNKNGDNVKLLEDTPAVLSLGKLCEEHGYFYEWTSGQKPQLIKNDRRIQCSTENYVPIVVLVYRPVLPPQLHIHLQHRYCRTLQSPQYVQQQHEVKSTSRSAR